MDDGGPKHTLGSIWFKRLFWVLVGGVLLTASGCRTDIRDSKLDQVYSYNQDVDPVVSNAQIDSVMAHSQAQSTAAKIATWARVFVSVGDQIDYVFGLAEGGYVQQGKLIDDRRHDCVSLVYRCSELAQASDHADALQQALRTRFAGAPFDSVILEDGRVDYERPEHLDFSLDMIRSGHWGQNITSQLSGAQIDTVGSARYPAGSFSYVSGENINPDDLQDGDLVWLVLNPNHKSGKKLRQTYGLVVGHLGVLVRQADQPWLVHAAQSDLDGWYQGNAVVQVPLTVYLERVDKFVGVMVTRFSE